MAATASIIPSEEVALVVLGKDKLKQSYPQEHNSEDPEATLRWSDACHGSTCETAVLGVSKSDMRPSPEGSREDAKERPVMDDEAFPKTPTTREDDEGSNGMPEVAAHVFVPIDPCCIERTPTGDTKKRKQQEYEEEIVRCEKEKGDSEKQNFIVHGYSAHFDDLPSYDGEQAKSLSERLQCLQCRNCNSISLKAVASMIGATIIFPCLIYGGYVFLPFDAPLMPTVSARLVYTLRCGVFATFPIIIGMVVYGVSRLCFSSLQPFGELRREVEIHRHYVSQSVHLFILYFFNIAVLSTYLPQEALKLIPLLTALFAISRLLYWLAYAMGRSFRGFGFGLTFLPLVAMLLFNLYSMFLLDPDNMFAIGDGSAETSLEKEKQLSASKPRYWG
ncbi:transmembrane protein 79 [Eublepharis macularius]|uniref:Transmembrane protein 79 n=1 Tax=Eublepharis macularius TaxID=481883 RepID=A0AA97L9H7_EUBMA|nr:transmembrane protein 79 [Eublepharis macularius]XP_054847174.1 transmembrane protein 79 [Eublepharis macularius]